jgi:hypothetical protein
VHSGIQSQLPVRSFFLYGAAAFNAKGRVLLRPVGDGTTPTLSSISSLDGVILARPVDGSLGRMNREREGYFEEVFGSDPDSSGAG